jgi:hypothetical protein
MTQKSPKNLQKKIHAFWFSEIFFLQVAKIHPKKKTLPPPPTPPLRQIRWRWWLASYIA